MRIWKFIIFGWQDAKRMQELQNALRLADATLQRYEAALKRYDNLYDHTLNFETRLADIEMHTKRAIDTITAMKESMYADW